MILAWLSAVFLLSVLVGAMAPPAGSVALVVLCFSLGLAALYRRSRVSLLFLLLAALCLGFWRAPHAPGRATSGEVRYYNGRPAELQGTIVAEPDIRDTGINYVISTQQMVIGGRTLEVAGLVEIHAPRSQQFEYGDVLSLRGRLRLPSERGAYRTVLAHRGIFSLMEFPAATDLGPASTGWQGWIVQLRLRLERGIDAWLPEPEAALLIAITLGARSASLGDLAPVLASTGIIHVIAISGIKVAMVAGTLYWVCQRATSRFLALAVPLMGTATYVVLTGATASGMRSALMWALLFLAAYLGRATVSVVSLAFVAALMTLVNPTLPWDIGFQLSVVGTAAIVAFSGPIVNAMRLIPEPFRSAAGVTIAAQVGTFPIVVSGWGLVSLLGPLVNTLVLPLLPALIVLGFLLGACSGLSLLAAPMSATAYALLHAVVLFVGLLGSAGSAPVPSLSPVITANYYVCLLVGAWYMLRRVNWVPFREWRSNRRELALACVLSASTLTVPLVHIAHRPAARLRALDSGGALLLESADRTVLIDGSAKPFSFLERLGSAIPYPNRTIDLLVVTDPRASNVASLDALFAHYSVSEVLDVGAEYPSGTYARWRADLRARHIPAYALRTGAQFQVGVVTLAVLGPAALCPDSRSCIGLLRVSMPGLSVLLAGAASLREQRETVFLLPSLRADVLVLAGTAGYDPAFLGAVRPRIIYGMEHPRSRLNTAWDPLGSLDLRK